MYMICIVHASSRHSPTRTWLARTRSSAAISSSRSRCCIPSSTAFSATNAHTLRY